MPIKVNKLDKDKSFTPHGEDWQGNNTIKASTLVYNVDDATSVKPILAKDVDGHVVWAKPFALTTTKVYNYDQTLNADGTYDYRENGGVYMDIATAGVFTRLSGLEPTKVVETAMPARWEAGLDSRRQEGTAAARNAKGIAEHLDYVFQGDKIQFMPVYSGGWEADYIKINNMLQPSTTGPFIIDVDETDVNIEVKTKRCTYDVNFSANIASSQGTTVTLPKDETKIAYNGGFIFDSESHAFYPIKPHNILLENHASILSTATWRDLIESSASGDNKIELQFNNYYDWCEYEYNITYIGGCHLFTDYGKLAESDSRYEPYKNLRVYLVDEEANIEINVVETPLLTTLEFSFIASDNPTDFYGNTPDDWAHLWHGTRTDVSTGVATRVYSNKIENVRIGSKVKFVDASYSDMCDVQLDFYGTDGTVVDSYTIRHEDDDIYSNYFYSITVNGKDITTLTGYTWTVEANDVNYIVTDVDHRYQMSSLNFEVDSVKSYGDWDDYPDEIPALTTWAINGGLVTFTIPSDYVRRYGGDQIVFARFHANDDTEQYIFDVEKVDHNPKTQPVTSGNDVDFTGYATRTLRMYTLSLGWQDDTEAIGQWLDVWDDPISSIDLPYGTIVHVDFPTTRRAMLSFDFPLGYEYTEDEEYVNCYAPEATEEFYYTISDISFSDLGEITGDDSADATIRELKQSYKLKLNVDVSNPYGAWYKSATGGTAITETDAIEYGSAITITEASDHSKYTLTIGTNTYYFRPTTNSTQYKYTLSGAVSSDTTLKKSTIITAGAKREVQKYKVTFMDKDVRYYYQNITPSSTTYEYEYGTTVTFDISPKSYEGYFALPQEVFANGSKLTPISTSPVEVDTFSGYIYNLKASFVVSGPTTITVNKIDVWCFEFDNSEIDSEGNLYVLNSAGTRIGSTDLDIIDDSKDIYISKGNTISLDVTFRSRLVYEEATYEGHTCYGSENADRIIYTSDISRWGSSGVSINIYDYEDNWLKQRIAEEDNDYWYEWVYIEATVNHTDTSSAYEDLSPVEEDSRAAVLKWNDGLAHNIYLKCGDTTKVVNTSGAIRFRDYDLSETVPVSTDAGWTIEPAVVTFGDSSNSPKENIFTFTKQSFTVSTQNLPSGTTITGTGTYEYGSSVTVTINAPANQYFRMAPSITGGIGSISGSEDIDIDDSTESKTYTYTFTMPAKNVIIDGSGCAYVYSALTINCSTYFTGSLTFLRNSTTKAVSGKATTTYYFSKAEGIKYNITAKSRLVYNTGTYGGHSCFGCGEDDRVITGVGSNSTGSASDWLRARWLGSETVYEEVYYNGGSTIFYDSRTIGTSTHKDSCAAPIYNNSGQSLTLTQQDLAGYAKTFSNGWNDIIFGPHVSNARNVTFSIPDSTHYTLTLTSGGNVIANPTTLRDSSASPGALITVTAPAKSYTITTTGEGGVVMTGGGTYTYGSTVNLSATSPGDRWVLTTGMDGWTGDSTQSVKVEKETKYRKATRTITVTGDATYKVGCQYYYTFSYESKDSTFPYYYEFVYSNGQSDTVAWNSYPTSNIAAGVFNYFKLKKNTFFNVYSRAHTSTGWLTDSITSYLSNGGDDHLITEWSATGLNNAFQYSTKVFLFNFYPNDPYIYVGFHIYDTDYEIANDVSITITKGLDSRSGYIQVNRAGSPSHRMRLLGTCNGVTRDFGRDRFAVGPYSGSQPLSVSGNSSSNYDVYTNIGSVSLADQFQPDSTSYTKYRAYITSAGSGWGDSHYAWHSGWCSAPPSHWSNTAWGWIMGTDHALLDFTRSCNAELHGWVDHGDCLKTTKIVWWGYSGSSSRWWWQSSMGGNASDYRHEVSHGVAKYETSWDNWENGSAMAEIVPNGASWSTDCSVAIHPHGWNLDSGWDESIKTKVKVHGPYYSKYISSTTYRPMLYWRGINCYRDRRASGYYWALTTFNTALPVRKS